jgi:CubicO group peptidase (beta-lactamase class C family)
VRIWFRFQVAVITCILAAVPVLAATRDSPLPSDTDIRNMLITRIDVQRRGTGAIYAFLSTYTLPRDPGTEYEYSNVGYGLLGQVLSTKSGLSYQELLHRRITKPIEMRSTALRETAEMKQHSATGYTADGRVVKDAERGALDASGALHSTANDLSKLLGVALGYRVSPLAPVIASMAETRRPGGMAPWATQIALAWNITKVGDREIVWKNGSSGGCRSFVGYDQAARVGVIGLINIQSDLGVDDIGMHTLGADVPVDLHVPRSITKLP